MHKYFFSANQFQSCHDKALGHELDTCLDKAIESAIHTIGSKGKLDREIIHYSGSKKTLTDIYQQFKTVEFKLVRF